MSRDGAARPEESTPMAKWLVLPMVLLAYCATSAVGATPRDRDHDGLPDRWERQHGLSTSAKSARRDPDRDGLANRREFRLRTNPRKRDTDGDGFSDRAEVRAKSNPRKRRSHPRRPPAIEKFPNPATTGVPAGWQPARTRSTDITVVRPGALVHDVLLTDSSNIIVKAPNVTIRRVKLQGGVIDNSQDGCNSGLVVEDSTIEPEPGDPYGSDGEGVVRDGGYTLRRVEIMNRGEGPRVSGCAPVTVEDSFIYIKGDEWPDCPRDLHSDGMQAYGGKGVNIRNATIIFGNHCGTSPYFMGYGGKSASVPTINTGTYNVDHLLVSGGGYVFRQQVPGSVTGLRIVRNWLFGPIDNRCSVLRPWEAKIVTIDANYRVTRILRKQRCNTEVVE